MKWGACAERVQGAHELERCSVGLGVPRRGRRAGGDGSEGPGAAAAPGGPAASVTSRGGASAAALGAQPSAERAQRRSGAARSARRGPMERYKGEGAGIGAHPLPSRPARRGGGGLGMAGGVSACASRPAGTQVGRASRPLPAQTWAEVRGNRGEGGS